MVWQTGLANTGPPRGHKQPGMLDNWGRGVGELVFL